MAHKGMVYLAGRWGQGQGDCHQRVPAICQIGAVPRWGDCSESLQLSLFSMSDGPFRENAIGNRFREKRLPTTARGKRLDWVSRWRFPIGNGAAAAFNFEKLCSSARCLMQRVACEGLFNALPISRDDPPNDTIAQEAPMVHKCVVGVLIGHVKTIGPGLALT